MNYCFSSATISFTFSLCSLWKQVFRSYIRETNVSFFQREFDKDFSPSAWNFLPDYHFYIQRKLHLDLPFFIIQMIHSLLSDPTDFRYFNPADVISIHFRHFLRRLFDVFCINYSNSEFTSRCFVNTRR